MHCVAADDDKLQLAAAESRRIQEAFHDVKILYMPPRYSRISDRFKASRRGVPPRMSNASQSTQVPVLSVSDHDKKIGDALLFRMWLPRERPASANLPKGPYTEIDMFGTTIFETTRH